MSKAWITRLILIQTGQSTQDACKTSIKPGLQCEFKYQVVVFTSLPNSKTSLAFEKGTLLPVSCCPGRRLRTSQYFWRKKGKRYKQKKSLSQINFYFTRHIMEGVKFSHICKTWQLSRDSLVPFSRTILCWH